jgi:hypothetical protein
MTTAIDTKTITSLERDLSPDMADRVTQTVDAIVTAKQRDQKVAVITGSGPNVHEGVTTLIAELMRLNVVDGVTTSAAVVAHEMGGVLDRVKRIDATQLGLDPAWLPLGNTFELTQMSPAALDDIEKSLHLDRALIEKLEAAPGNVILKAAGNLGYPMGLWIEWLAADILTAAKTRGQTFEQTAGRGCDPRTMLGIGAEKNIPVLVTIPQLVGGGAVGLAVGDSVSITHRAERLADMLASAAVVIESAVALTQEIHDGPFETHTGHGLWAAWQGHPTYSLRGKTLVRIDLDPALEQVWQAQRADQSVQAAIDKGQPKTKLFKVPFRMEMSGFARLASSIAITGDIGAIWPIIAARVLDRLNLTPRFMSYPQHTAPGQAMREWIADEIQPIHRSRATQI